MEFPPSVASQVLLIILSAVSPFAELLSGEIKTFVNFTARQWSWLTTWGEAGVGWSSGLVKGQEEPAAAWTGLLFTRAPSGHPHKGWHYRLAGLLQCSPPFL